MAGNVEQRFFPVECVAGVVEVKSRLSKADLKTPLIKLAESSGLSSFCLLFCLHLAA